MEGGVLNVELPRSRSVLTPCFNGSKLSELHRHLHFQNTTPMELAKARGGVLRSHDRSMRASVRLYWPQKYTATAASSPSCSCLIKVLKCCSCPCMCS
jgi:hypothetical protein